MYSKLVKKFSFTVKDFGPYVKAFFLPKIIDVCLLIGL